MTARQGGILQDKWLRAQSGTAAIEFALILPILMTLAFGMLELSMALSTQQKLTYSATVVAQLVSQKAPEITAAQIDDSFTAGRIAVRKGPVDENVRVEVFAFRMNGAVADQIWERSNGLGQPCAAPDIDDLPLLMNGPNDVVVVVVCTTHAVQSAWVVDSIVGNPTIDLQEQMIVRPREFSNINCPTCT